MRATVTAILLGTLVAAGCAPDPLTLEERLQLMIHMNRQLQFELRERDRRIAELMGGEGSTLPERPREDIRRGEPLIEDPFKAVRITLGRVTGGADFDGVAGDDGVRVLILPEDRFGHVVKRAAALEVELYDLALDAKDRRIARWELTVHQAVHEWVEGPLGVRGYSLQLRWPNGKPPAHDRLTLLVRLTTLDGRALTAQKDFTVALPPVEPPAPSAPPG